MDFLYIDETGKNIFIDINSKGLFIYGGIIINKTNLNKCLNEFKVIYQKHRKALNEELRNQILESDPSVKGIKIRTLLSNYEVHSYYMFNKGNPEKNPWAYYSIQNKYHMAHEIVASVIPYIEKILYFKADRTTLSPLFDELGIIDSNSRKNATIRDRYTEEKLVECMIEKYHDWLVINDRKGSIIPDEFESAMRELFLDKLHSKPFDLCWNEPIIVRSNLNAFTQIADLFTYIFMKAISSKPKSNKAFKKLYWEYIATKSIVYDLHDYIGQSELD